MNKKAIRILNAIAGLNEEVNDELIDEIICNSINNGIDINAIDEEINEDLVAYIWSYIDYMRAEGPQRLG